MYIYILYIYIYIYIYTYIYIYSEETHEIVDELRLKQYNNGISKKKLHSKIIQRQLQTRTTKKYLTKDIYLQKKDKKLMII